MPVLWCGACGGALLIVMPRGMSFTIMGLPFLQTKASVVSAARGPPGRAERAVPAQAVHGRRLGRAQHLMPGNAMLRSTGAGCWRGPGARDVEVVTSRSGRGMPSLSG